MLYIYLISLLLISFLNIMFLIEIIEFPHPLSTTQNQRYKKLAIRFIFAFIPICNTFYCFYKFYHLVKNDPMIELISIAFIYYVLGAIVLLVFIKILFNYSVILATLFVVIAGLFSMYFMIKCALSVMEFLSVE